MRVGTQHLLDAVLVPEQAEWTDARLLGFFIDHRDDAAFGVLVRRHGAMVLGVCRRMLPNHHDVEDAFQATFLVLVRKATSVSPREMVGNWLYGVAYQTAAKARAVSSRRRAKERPVSEAPEPETVEPDDALWREFRLVIDQELSRLPAKYRAPLVLCDMTGFTRKEAAEQLDWPEGTVSGRLSRARAMLAARLARRGVVPGVFLAVLLSESAASACVPAALADSTVQAARHLVANPAAIATVSAKVAVLIQGVEYAMLLTKLKIVAAVILTVGFVVSGAEFALSPSAAAGQIEKNPTPSNDKKDDGKKVESQGDGQKNQNDDGQQNQGVVKAVDPNGDTITIAVNQKGKPVEKVFALPKNVPVVVAKPAKLADIKPGMRVNVQLGQDKKAVVELREAQVDGENNQKDDGQKNQKDDGQKNQNDDGQKNQNDDGQKNQKDDGQQNQGVVKAVDPNGNAITITVNQKSKPFDKVFALPKNVPVVVAQAAQLGDIKPGMKVIADLGRDKKGVVGIRQVQGNAQDENGNGQNNQKGG